MVFRAKVLVRDICEAGKQALGLCRCSTSTVMYILDWITIIFALFFCLSTFVYYVLRRLTRHRVRLKVHTGRVMFVTAHPDDECMFFAPTILTLTRSGQYDVFLLCLSSGNYNQQGRVRQQELMISCAMLGIRQSNVFVLDHRDIVDDPSVTWSRDLVSKLLSDYVKNYLIDIIFTFDEYGVSGHVNHSSVHHGIQQFLASRDCPPGIQCYQLESVCRLRKYLSFVELGLSFIISPVIFVSGWSELVKAQAAMYAHRSQLVWFRVLYVIFSLYMITNTYKPIQRTL